MEADMDWTALILGFITGATVCLFLVAVSDFSESKRKGVNKWVR